MIADMMRSMVGDQLPPEQADRLCQLVSEAASRVGPIAAMGIMGELMLAQALLSAGDVDGATVAALGCAERHDMHDLAEFLRELAGGDLALPAPGD